MGVPKRIRTCDAELSQRALASRLTDSRKGVRYLLTTAYELGAAGNRASLRSLRVVAAEELQKRLQTTRAVALSEAAAFLNCTCGKCPQLPEG